MLKDDWATNQIHTYAKMISKVVLDKDTATYRCSAAGEDETDALYVQLSLLIRDGKFNEGENFLFEQLDPENRKHLELAVDFYARLNDLSDRELDAGDFSREEVDEGLKEAARLFGFNVL